MSEKKVEKNKRLKKERLEEAGYECFLEYSFEKTSIDQIVQKAGVAKGTFYLYFEDKTQLLNRVIIKKSGIILQEALSHVFNFEMENKIDQFIVMSDCILDYFKENQNVLMVVKNHLSWDAIGEDIRSDVNYPIKEMMNDYINLLMKNRNLTQDEAIQTLYLIFELLTTIAYQAIIVKQPYDISTIKPILYATIRNMLK